MVLQVKNTYAWIFQDTQPIGAIMLVNYQITRTPDCGKPHGFSIEKSGASGLQLAGDNDEATTRWMAVISHAIERSTATDTWLEATRRNLRLTPQSIHKPDCFGYLNKLGTKWKSWVKRYCVLKDACLYFYQDANAKNAYGELIIKCLYFHILFLVIETNRTGKNRPKIL